MGTADNFAVLAGSTITNAGASVITGDMAVSPGTALTGFPPGQHIGVYHTSSALAVKAKADLADAYDDAVARTTTSTTPTELGGTTKTTGVYNSVSGTFNIATAATVTLDAEGDPGAVFIFKTASTIITGAGARVTLANGAQACNVFWQVGSSATFGANSVIHGDVLAFTSITVGAGLTVDGRMLAINGAVTMDNDRITRSTCDVPRELSITAPVSAGLGSAAPGGLISGHLGVVKVTDLRGLPSAAAWTATLTATNFTTAAPVQTVSRTIVSCWSGPFTATTGDATFTPGQSVAGDAQFLDQGRTSFAVTSGVGSNSVTWNPTCSIRLPLSAVAGEYTGTLTLSVA